MKTLNPTRPPDPCESTGFVLALTLAAVVLACTAGIQAQASQDSAARIDTLRSRIKSATDQHAPDPQLGTLWLRLATQYQNQFELQQAEEAFTQALSLLRSPTTQPALGDALEGLGSLYFQTGRTTEAENCLRRSLAIFETLGDQIRIAALHETLAMGLVFAHRFREGETESRRALDLLQTQAEPDPREVAAALVTHSYALCFQSRCRDALDDANRALTLAKAILPADSSQLAAVWMTLGFAQWKSGSLEEGGAAMREAIRIVHDRTGTPPLLQRNSELVVLRQYTAYLKSTHRKPEAAQLETQIQQLQSQRPHACTNCTINAAAFASHSARQ